MKTRIVLYALLVSVIFGMSACNSGASVEPILAPPVLFSSPAPTSTSAPEVPPMSIRYLGHSSFYILASDGSRIVTDPYGIYPPFLTFPQGIEADGITISHVHADHTATDRVDGQPLIIREPISATIGQVKVTGYPAFHGKYQGTMISNIIFVFEFGEVKVVHLGELGKIDTVETLEAIVDADVMFAPVGVVGSMSYDQLRELIQQTRPRTIIPQHFSLSAAQRWYGLGTVDEFLAAMPADWLVNYEEELNVTNEMPSQVVVLTNRGIP